MATLTSEERRTVKAFAKEIIRSPAPKWSDVGHDRKEEWFTSILKNLRESENTRIASILESHRQLACTLLQEKTKSMREQARTESNRYI
jgi:hypothetical protein